MKHIRPESRALTFGIGTVFAAVALLLIARSVDSVVFTAALREVRDQPYRAPLGLVAFGVAFLLRARAWQMILPSLPFGHALAAVHLALGANHVLPFRLGEPFRVLSVVRRTSVGVEAASSSAVALRAGDVLSVIGLGILVAPVAFADLIGPIGWVAVGIVVGIAVFSWRWLGRIVDHYADVRMPGLAVVVLSTTAWLAEAVLIHQTARWVGIELSWSQAILITTVAVAAQITAIAPGGFGTYEAASVAAYAALGHDLQAGLVAAIAAHTLKTAYSLVAGGVALFVPRPGMFGRFRLSSRPGDGDQLTRPDRTGDETSPDAPIVLFMPAHDEEASVAGCVSRAPASVLGYPVQVLVIDDGSSDATVRRASAAGADVLSLGANLGLGNAIRVGLHEATDRGAVAIAFCDADGEYHPEELERLVAPILADDADYVVGSRFLGNIEHMLPWRRFGNVVLTKLLSLVAAASLTDGQSGYRAFSPAAAASAEIIHDFNYAQVLTLDLLAKGYRYDEVPISYRFRVSGESFVRLGPYLRRVVPAVYRELNAS